MQKTPLSNLFMLFAAANECPTPDTVKIYTEGLLKRDFETVWSALELPAEPLREFCDALDCYIGMDGSRVLSELRKEYTRLFLTEDRLVMNCQGPWQSKKEGKAKVLFMVNPYSTEISDFMRYCGVVRSRGYNDSMDMVENEWRFCSILADGPHELAGKGIDPLAKLDEFIDRYMKDWIPEYADDVTAATRIPYFAALAKIQVVFLDLY